MEELSVNIAKAAMTAQSALAKTVFAQPEAGSAPADPFQVGPAMTEVMGSLATQTGQAGGGAKRTPDRLYGTVGQDDAPDARHRSRARPSRRTSDSADPHWQENVMFDMMKQSYLLSSNWINKLISSAEGVDPMVKRRAEFFTKLLTDAMSPSNFLMSNPAALQALLDTRGESLVKGMERFAEDMARGDGKLKISQADTDSFVVGAMWRPRRARSSIAANISNCCNTARPRNRCAKSPC